MAEECFNKEYMEQRSGEFQAQATNVYKQVAFCMDNYFEWRAADQNRELQRA